MFLEVIARIFFAIESKGFEKTRVVMLGKTAVNFSQRVIDQAYLLYIPAPLFMDHGLIQHNAHGYRGPIIPMERNPNKHRVLCLGGSTT